MNHRFAQHVRSTAFDLKLSHTMIQALLMAEIEQSRKGYLTLWSEGMRSNFERRGFLRDLTEAETKVIESYVEQRILRNVHPYKLTRVGELTVALLYEAKFDLDEASQRLVEVNAEAPPDDEPELQIRIKRKAAEELR